MIIVIFILIAICGVLIYQLSKKKQVDDEIRQQNEQLNFRKKEIENDIKWLTEQTIEYNKRIDEQKQEIKEHIEQKNAMLEEDKRMSEQAMESYMQILDEKYIDIENEFDAKIANKHLELCNTQKELDKLKETRAAAHKALLKEQEVKENKDNYRLIISEAEKRDIKLLNSVKKELINERPVNMIIWQTYYSKKANELCSRILGTKTITGIYKITEISTEKCYIGQSKNIKERFREHMKCGLGIDTPSGNKLYQAMLNSSIEDFTFELIEECNENDLDEKERYFIELYEAYDYGFNSNRGNKNSYKN